MSENTKVLIETSLGNITVELFEKEAPVTVANFLAYVDDNFYAGTVFHRVIKGFMIQGGGLDADLRDVPSKRAPIKNEAGNGLSNKVGTIAMARTAVVDSATSQFFINTAPNSFLDHQDETPRGFGYCVFGQVTDGMDVVRAIEASPTTSVRYYDDVPSSPITIFRVSRIAAK